ncbi:MULTISPECIES: hypothetical protein [Deinococcus]|uniref:Uncharacterized protein n=1 Tax=Deinococcus rufus TaxID=2136097 RepID=A0ABV7Z8U9_9DEIO|nr:hypothetical protein [Deinococcus sp. AB2017081]WQE96298.1 hypothetical protein U2P90_05225 [Deinococcus sp. AB2017081]
MTISFEDALDELLREGFVYFPAAQRHIHAHKDLECASLTFGIGYGLGMFDDLTWWMRENFRLFPVGSCKSCDSYDLYIGEDDQLYAIDGAWYCYVYRVGQNVRDGLEGIAAGQLEERRKLIRPVREVD